QRPEDEFWGDTSDHDVAWDEELEEFAPAPACPDDDCATMLHDGPIPALMAAGYGPGDEVFDRAFWGDHYGDPGEPGERAVQTVTLPPWEVSSTAEEVMPNEPLDQRRSSGMRRNAADDHDPSGRHVDLPGPAVVQPTVSDPEGATGVNAPHRAGEPRR